MNNNNPHIRFGSFLLTANVRALRLLFWLAASMAPVYIVYQLAPLIDRAATISRALGSPEYRAAEKDVYESITKTGRKKVSFVDIPASDLTTVAITIAASVDGRGAPRAPSIHK
jgi:hypothetical protein